MRKFKSLYVVLGVSLLATMGCGQSSLSPIEGKVILDANAPFSFAGDTLEIRSQTDPASIAYAEIQADGTFRVESLKQGKIVQGAEPGRYQARIVISTDDPKHKDYALKAIPKKYLKFETSELLVEAPSVGNELTIRR